MSGTTSLPEASSAPAVPSSRDLAFSCANLRAAWNSDMSIEERTVMGANTETELTAVPDSLTLAVSLAVCMCSPDGAHRELADKCASMCFKDSNCQLRLTDSLLALVRSETRTSRVVAASCRFATQSPARAAALDILSYARITVPSCAVGKWLEAMHVLAANTKEYDDVIERALVAALHQSFSDLDSNWETCGEIAKLLASRAPPFAQAELGNVSRNSVRGRRSHLAQHLATLYLRCGDMATRPPQDSEITSAAGIAVDNAQTVDIYDDTALRDVFDGPPAEGGQSQERENATQEDNSRSGLEGVCLDWRAVGGLVDLFIQFLPEDRVLEVLSCRASFVDPGMDPKDWINLMQGIVLHYFTRESRVRVRLEALRHIRSFLFEHRGFDCSCIVTDVLGHIIPHERRRADEAIEAVDAHLSIHIDALCSPDLSLDRNALKVIFEFLAEAANGRRAGAAEAVTAVHGLRSILQSRLDRRPAWIARKIVYMLYSVFLMSPFCRAAGESARTLALISASCSGCIVLHPSYVPSDREGKVEYVCEVRDRLDIEHGQCQTQSNVKNRCNHSVLRKSDDEEVRFQNISCSGVEKGEGMSSSQAGSLSGEGDSRSIQKLSGIVDEVASSSGAARFSRRVSMRGKPRVPMVGSDVFSTVLRVRTADQSTRHGFSGVDPNDMITEDSAEGETLFAADYMVRSIIDTLISVRNRHLSADIAIAEALRHAVTDVSLNRVGCHEYVGSQLCKILTGHEDVTHIAQKVLGSERLRTALSASLCAIATFLGGNLPRNFWDALVPRSNDIYDSSSLYQAAEACVLHSTMQDSARYAHLAEICRMAIRTERDTRNSILVVPADSGQECVMADAKSPLPDAFDFAALETMELILMFDTSTNLANEALNLVVDGVGLSPEGSGLECNVDGRYSTFDGNLRLRWTRLSFALFCYALSHVTCSQRAAIAGKLRPLSDEGNICAAFLLEYCTCYSPHTRTMMRHSDFKEHDHFFVVDAGPLPYLVAVRGFASGDALVCQRRATCASVQRVSGFLSPVSADSLLPRRPLHTVDVVAANANVETMHVGLNVKNHVLEIVSSYWPDPLTRPAALADLVADKVNSDTVHPGASASAATAQARREIGDEVWAYGVVEQLGAGGANKVTKIVSVQQDDVEDIDFLLSDEIHEIGVVYVPEDINTADDILGAEWDGTKWYHFLKQLGTFIPFDSVRNRSTTADGSSSHARSDVLNAARSTDVVRTPIPFLGSLSPRTDGTHYLAYAERARQVVFVVPSLIPDNSQFVTRRQAVALNCKVVLVWNESGRRFDPATFDTQFLMVVIVISPTKTHDICDDISLNQSTPFGVADRFRVKVFSSVNATFGPLRPDMEGYVVPGDKLCSLVRLTAIHAHIAVVAELDKHARESMKCEDRATAIRTTISNSSVVGN
jgi:Rap/ran-GAP